MAQRKIIEDRRKKILEYIKTNQNVRIRELSKLLNETDITIRRDLIELEKSRIIIRTHGGAVLNEQKKSVWQTSSILNRLERNKEQKTRIANFAQTLINDNESIFIDGGSTNQILSSLIKDRKNMLAVTNSPDIARILLENEENQIILIGGEIMRDTRITLGPDSVDDICKYYVNKCVTSVSGIDPDIGCYTAIPSEAVLKRALISHARETILLVDSSKFYRKAFSMAFDLSEISTIVTDSGISKDIIEKLENKNIKVIVV